jgi:hypothetical protein
MQEPPNWGLPVGRRLSAQLNNCSGLLALGLTHRPSTAAVPISASEAADYRAHARPKLQTCQAHYQPLVSTAVNLLPMSSRPRLSCSVWLTSFTG